MSRHEPHLNRAMTIAFVHTDFRLYWKSRLEAFNEYCNARGDRLVIVEIAGKGSPYSFAGTSAPAVTVEWHVLFPGDQMEEIPSTSACSKVEMKLDEIAPDVVIAGAIAFSSGAASVSWARRNQKAVVIFDDSRTEDIHRNFLVNYVKRIIYQNVDAIFCPAPSHLPTFTRFGFSPEQVFYGVDVVDNNYFFERTPEARRLYRQDEPGSRKFLLCVGRQVPKKNLGRLVDVFIAYRKLHPHSSLNLMLIGEGPEHARLFEKVAGTYSHVIFLPFQKQEVLVTYYSVADAFIFPSLFSETWGLVVNEAMACGLPVFVSERSGCAQSLVDNRRNGWTFDPADPLEIYKVIQFVDEMEPAERDRMGQCSIDIIKNWGLERFCDGAYASAIYAVKNKKVKKGLLSSLVVQLWKGRYRPV